MARNIKHFCLGLAASLCYRTETASRPTETDFIGNGVLARAPTILTEGAIYRLNADPSLRALAARRTSAGSG
jgi:hypothetical protein